jgi:pectinesterase
MKKVLCIIIFFVQLLNTDGQKKIVVDANGNGDFKTIQAAINSLPATANEARTIFIKKGVYNEKLFIEKSNIVLEGEEKEKTIITAAIARDEWRCEHKDDWGVATVNVKANDISLLNLTIVNSFGFDFKEDKIIDCPLDTVNRQKKISKNGHQMALRAMNCTRLKAINCHFKSLAGDTVSPWETENGMWYFKDCLMEGGVDFYCPHGWAYAEHCEFVTHGGTAAIWHDGSGNIDSKTVLVNCRFKGYDGFMLGRYHREAQFYLIGCVFADNMKDSAIYRVTTNNVINWGHRVYYYNCHRKAGDYKWFADNINKESADKINAKWVFGEKWGKVE